MKSIALIAAALPGSLSAQAGPKAPQLTETLEQHEARIKGFRVAKFGLFIHRGSSTISGEKISQGMENPIDHSLACPLIKNFQIISKTES